MGQDETTDERVTGSEAAQILETLRQVQRDQRTFAETITRRVDEARGLALEADRAARRSIKYAVRARKDISEVTEGMRTFQAAAMTHITSATASLRVSNEKQNTVLSKQTDSLTFLKRVQPIVLLIAGALGSYYGAVQLAHDGAVIAVPMISHVVERANPIVDAGAPYSDTAGTD